jgi:SAM-dependent methyltransferase
MGEVHEVAARGFEAEAETYDRARPSYPQDAVDWLIGALDIGPGRRLVDLAAGTGKLTALIAGAGADLAAVEPVPAMRALLRQRLPGLPVLAGVAESLPFAARSLDAVTVAQAFHWFDAGRAMAELARVVKPGGHLGLIWNARDRSVDWVDQVWSVLDRVERQAPWRDHRDGTGCADTSLRRGEGHLVGDLGSGWTPWNEARFYHAHESSHQDVIDRMRSVSHIAVLPPAEQQAVLGEIRTVLTRHPETRDKDLIAIPYRVDVMCAERLG